MAELSGRFALVTGGSSGIGASAVRHLAEAGAAVAVGYNQGKDRADHLVSSLPGRGHVALRVPLTDVREIAAARDRLSAEFGRLDILVNSAGFTRVMPHADLDALDEALFDTILISNLRGPYSIIRALMPLLKRSDDALVVNVSSISAFTGLGSNMAYCAAKAGLDTLTMSLARALGPIRFVCVSPGAVATDFVAGRDRATLEQQAQSVPLRRVVEPEDVAKAILACATHLTTATGTRIVVDAGRHL